MSIKDEIKYSFTNGSMLTKLIYINLGVFLVVKLFTVILFLFNIPPESQFSIVYWFGVPADIGELLHKPWTVFTYMFLHQDFLSLFPDKGNE